jgi:two-component system NtrC family sensor kinase
MSQKSYLRSKSLSTQLLLSFCFILVTAGLATLGVNYHLVKSELEKEVLKQAHSVTQSLEFATEGLIETQNTSILRRMVQNYTTLPAVIEIVIVDPQGKPLAQSSLEGIHGLYEEIYPELKQTVDIQQATEMGIELQHRMNLNNKSILIQLLPFSSTLFESSNGRGLAIAILDLEQIHQNSQQILVRSLATQTTGILVILSVMWLLVHRLALYPIERLNNALMCSRETGQFVLPASLPDNEIKFLATTFDRVFQNRKVAEVALQISETQLRQKAQELEVTLQELQNTQSQMIQSEKMSGLGQMVAGVAHEINNPVNFIHGNLNHANGYIQDLLELIDLYQRYNPCPPDEILEKAEAIDLDFLKQDFPQLLSSMKVGSQRIREIVKSLRNFSRLDEAECKPVDIHEGIESTLMILQNRLKAKPDHPEIMVIKDYGQLPLVECYSGQLNQAFMNILTNAIDALDTYNQQRTKDELQSNPSRINIRTTLIADNWITIYIADNGPGIAEQDRVRLFDPFFTTKPVGKGTGLGLSISYQIVEKHSGKLRCESALGQGAEFMIEIPIRQDLREAA